ncbi:Predicted transcriptional regulator [Haladaptatus litoreus]|uniref:Predicted transcriptional regulator n=1 Tax=Haladaptatus litoreus TaxID=553468 RepID=A0A1N7EFS4_9EURY|nr:hypothetical protein [Haladaptatus litoreus]SIR86869.1 Predicted transcriptional regulator [Haladaptatus litoreus]
MIDTVKAEVDMLERHLHVLEMVRENEPIGIVKMSNESDHARHEIRYSLRKLEEANLINPTKQGAVSTDQTPSFIENLDEQLDKMQARIAAMRPGE